jgi:hypothetical protein
MKVAFVMTINKSQGLYVKYVGLNLMTPIFVHGKLYVTFSRTTSINSLKKLFLNKMYKEQ